jgi:hypothetical protein
MPTQYFAGNSLASFFRTSPISVETTTAGRFNSTYVPSAITIPDNLADYVQTAAFSATGTVWTAFDFYTGSIASVTSNGPTWYNGTTGIFRLKFNSSGFTPEYWNGSAWTATGSAAAIAAAVLYRITVKITLNSGFELYINGTLVSSGSGWSGSSTTMTNVRFYNNTQAQLSFISQVMIADYDIRDSHLYSVAINGNSASNTGAASGVYTDVNETVLDETTAINISASGNKAGQTHATFTLPTGYTIAAAVISARGRATGSITDGKLGWRYSGTNYSSSGKSYNGSYEPRQLISTTNPGTSAAWTQTSFNNAELYLEAA